jgi:hypothetical protein
MGSRKKPSPGAQILSWAFVLRPFNTESEFWADKENYKEGPVTVSFRV